MMPIVLVMVIFYFLLIRPQQKRAKAHKEMLSKLSRGDKIVTNGGIAGTIVKVVDDSTTVDVEIAKDVKVQVVRAMIAEWWYSDFCRDVGGRVGRETGRGRLRGGRIHRP